MPAATSSWPRLAWESVATGPALDARIRQLAELARRFEAAMEQAAEDDQADLSTLDDELADWDRAAAEVFVHTAFGEGKPVAPGEVGARAKALEKAWGKMSTLRARMLHTLGSAAEGVLSREPGVAIDPALLAVGQGMPQGDFDANADEGEADFFQDLPAEKLRHPPAHDEPPEHLDGEIDESEAYLGDELDGGEPSAGRGLAPLTGEKTASAPERVASPVRPEEVRQRQAAQAKAYPAGGSLAALLALLPLEWIAAVHQSLKLPPAGEEDLSAGSRSALLRGPVHKHLRSPEGLAKVVAALGPKEKEILSALLRLGSLSYARVTAKWGLDDADGYAWAERPASGPLSTLRRLGLAFVCTLNGAPVVAAPTDLAEELRKLLAQP